MSRNAKPETTQEDQKKTSAADASATGPETGPQTPATGNGGAAEAGEATAVAAPAGAAASDAAPSGQMVGAEGWEVVVTGPAKGRWRAGRHFGPEPVVIPAPDLTEAMARALADDPELTFVPRRIGE